MTRKIEFTNTNDLINRYVSGEPAKEIARSLGVSYNVIARILRENDIPIIGRKIDHPNRIGFIDRYIAGESEKSLSSEAGINRYVFRRWLKDAGISPRNRSAGMIARWVMTDSDGRAAMLTNAHIAAKNRIDTVECKIARAITKERIGRDRASIGENILTNDLVSLGYSIIQQKAVGVYNIDIAIDGHPVAVEIFGGGWHASKQHISTFHERVKYLFDSGWHVIIVWVDGLRFPLTSDCAKYIHSFVNELSRYKPVNRQYRVILGNGKTATIRKSYLNTPADIERFCHCVDTTWSEYDIAG